MTTVQPKTFLITGATGGIGGAIAEALASRGARLVLLVRDPAELCDTVPRLESRGAQVRVVAADLLAADMGATAAAAVAAFGVLDGIINCAGVQNFGHVVDEPRDSTAKLFAINLVAPIQLIQSLLPHFQGRPLAHVVNIGSIFGSIGFPCFATYSASKFGLRGFSEALRRELAETAVRVHYVAPRYTRTALNSGPVARMAEALKMKQDDPDWVAAQVVAAIERDAAETYLGWPEKLFVRINAILPRLVDGALIRQAREMRPFLRRRAA